MVQVPMVTILRGERVLLRPPQPSDKADRLAIGRHAEFVRMNGGDDRALTPLTTEDVECWYARLAAERFGWVIEIAGHCAGVARLPHYDAVNRRADFAIGIF